MHKIIVSSSSSVYTFLLLQFETCGAFLKLDAASHTFWNPLHNTLKHNSQNPQHPILWPVDRLRWGPRSAKNAERVKSCHWALWARRMSSNAVSTLVQAFISRRLDYCNSLFSFSWVTIDRPNAVNEKNTSDVGYIGVGLIEYILNFQMWSFMKQIHPIRRFRADATQLSSWVASASAVSIGHINAN